MSYRILPLLLCTVLINEIISSPVDKLNQSQSGENLQNAESTNGTMESRIHENSKQEQTPVDKEFKGSKSVLENIIKATYFPPSNGRLMHSISGRVKDESNSTKNCTIKVWRENITESQNSSVTFECDDLRKRRNVNLDLPRNVSTEGVKVKMLVNKGVRMYAETMVNSNNSVLNEITEAQFYPEGYRLMYKIRILMAKCGEKSVGCEQMRCIVYAWRNMLIDDPVSIECDPIEEKTREMKQRDAEKDLDVEGDASILQRSRRFNQQDEAVNMSKPLAWRYALKAIDKYGSPNKPEMKGVIVDIAEATAFPSSGSLLYEIKLKVGSTNCTRDSNQRNCEYNPNDGFNKCEIKVFKDIFEPLVTMICWENTENFH